MVENPGGINWKDSSPAYNDSLLNPFGNRDYPIRTEQLNIDGYITSNIIWLSECCTANPIGELDMSSVPFGGPSGFCSRCHDNCIFIVEDDNEN